MCTWFSQNKPFTVKAKKSTLKTIGSFTVSGTKQMNVIVYATSYIHIVYVFNVNIYTVYIKGVPSMSVYIHGCRLAASCKYVDIRYSQCTLTSERDLFCTSEPFPSPNLDPLNQASALCPAHPWHLTGWPCHHCGLPTIKTQPSHLQQLGRLPRPDCPPPKWVNWSQNAERSEIHWRVDSLNAKSIGTFFGYDMRTSGDG